MNPMLRMNIIDSFQEVGAHCALSWESGVKLGCCLALNLQQIVIKPVTRTPDHK